MMSGPPGTVDRQTILERASLILAEEGVHALSMRRIAADVGASTIVLYTHFRNKQEIVDELYCEGFAGLQTRLEAVEGTDDAVSDLAMLGRAYRLSALEWPTHYQVMFNPCLPGFAPSGRGRQASADAFDVLRQGVARCAEAGTISTASVHGTAETLWGTLHGLVSLELLGLWAGSTDGEARVEEALALLRSGLLTSPAAHTHHPSGATGRATPTTEGR